METIVLAEDEQREEYLQEQLSAIITKLLDLHFTPEEIIIALLHRITILYGK